MKDDKEYIFEEAPVSKALFSSYDDRYAGICYL